MAAVEDEHRDLRVVPPPPEEGQPGPDAPATATPDQSDLVAEIVADSGLLPSEKLEAVRSRARGGSFSRALVAEGFASFVGVAWTLAEQYPLPLVDLAVEGDDAEASKQIPVAVLERVCAIPFSFDGYRLRVAVT